MRITEVALAVTTTGSAGSATGTTVSRVFPAGAEVLSVEWAYDAAAPATTDVQLYDTGLGATNGLIDSKANSATDTTTPRFPRINTFQDNAAANLAATEAVERYTVKAGGTLTAKVLQSDALAPAATATVRLLEY